MAVAVRAHRWRSHGWHPARVVSAEAAGTRAGR